MCFIKRTLWGAVLVGGCLIALQAEAGFLDMPEIEETPQLKKRSMLRDLDIPAVRQRDSDPSAGPRLAVSEFRVQGLVEYPELGITREEINKMVNEIRADLMNEGEYLPSGYTQEELGELSDLLVEIEGQTLERHVTPEEVQRLVWLVREQRNKRGILLSQIEAVADRITMFYRQRGFIMAKAYIPKQQVRDGVVNLTLLLGVLGEVRVQGNKIYSDDKLKSVFDDMMAQPVTAAAVEENLYLINDFPGVNAEGYFEPGFQVGDTRLNINVKNEERYNVALRFDNHGTEETGKRRYYADLQLNNLLGHADTVNLSVLGASAPSNTSYWRLNYKTDLFSPRFKAMISSSKNQFVIDKSTGPASLELHGTVTLASIAGRYALKRSRIKSYFIDLSFERVESDLQIGSLPDTDNRLDDIIDNKAIQFYYDILHQSAKALHQGSVKYTAGRYVHGAEVGQKEHYGLTSLDYTLLKFWTLPYVNSETRLILQADTQYAGDNLSSIVRFSLGGPSRVRAYSSRLFSADDGAYLGASWIFNMPAFMNVITFNKVDLRRFAKPFIFYDYAYGKQHSIVAGEDDVTGKVKGAGIGVQVSHGEAFRGNIQLAFPVGQEFSKLDVAQEESGRRLVFDFQYSF